MAASRVTGSNAGTQTLSSYSVTSASTADGGNGGSGYGVGHHGGDGASNVATASGRSTGGGAVSVSISQTGGAGGDGLSGANGGNGADSILSSTGLSSDPLQGFTSGSLTLTQTAVGGSGGDSNAGLAGKAGNASSTLVVTNSSSTLSIATSATGGAGANGSGGSSSGVGGNASSYASAASSSGHVSSSSTANGGAGSTIPGIIDAQAIANGGKGSQANAAATATGLQISAQATVNNSIAGISDTIAAIGQPIPESSSSMGKEAVAYGTALPLVADAKSVLAGQPTVNHDFDLGGNSQAWLLGNMSVLNTSTATALHDYHSMLNLSINTASISNPQDVLVGLLDPLFGNNNFLSGKGDSLAFSYNISGAGGSNAHTYTFNSTNINTALDFFNDKTLDVGSLSSFVSSNNKMLSLVFNLDLHTATSGTGLNLGLIAGNSTIGSGPVPLPASFWLLGSALAGMLGFSRRKNLS